MCIRDRNNCWGVHSGLVKCILQWCCWQKLNIGADHSNYPSRAPEQWVAFSRCAGIFKNTCQSTGIYLHRHGQLRLHDFMHRRMAQSVQHSNWIPLWAWKRMPLKPSARIPCSVARILCFGKLLKSMAPAFGSTLASEAQCASETYIMIAEQRAGKTCVATHPRHRTWSSQLKTIACKH